MKKILLALDALDFRSNALDFAAFIAKLSKSQVIGVFLENLVPRVVKPAYELTNQDTLVEEGTEVEQQIIERNINLFIDGCISREVNGVVHLDMGVPINEMITESRYADLVIIPSSMSFEKKYEIPPSGFVKEVLTNAECPVLIAPENFNSIDSIIFTYNGSKSSVFAIKHFLYLFPQFADKNAIVVQVNQKNDWNIDEKLKLEEWLKPYYQHIDFALLNGDTKEELFRYLLKKKNAFIIMGAYGRNAASNFFQHSKAEFLIRTLNLPFFITHY